MTSTKPQCGGGGVKQDDYDLPLHVAALFLVLLMSIGGAGFPVVAKRVSWLKIPPKIFFFCKHFGTGVLIATAFVHLIPTAFQSLNDPCLPDLLTVQYPAMPGVIMMASLFSLFVIEMVLKSKTGGHSHGGPTGEGLSGQGAPPGISVLPRDRGRPTMRDDIYPDEKDAAFARDDEVDSRPVTPSDIDLYGLPSEMPPWFQVFFARYIRQREEMKSMIMSYAPQSESGQFCGYVNRGSICMIRQRKVDRGSGSN